MKGLNSSIFLVLVILFFMAGSWPHLWRATSSKASWSQQQSHCNYHERWVASALKLDNTCAQPLCHEMEICIACPPFPPLHILKWKSLKDSPRICCFWESFDASYRLCFAVSVSSMSWFFFALAALSLVNSMLNSFCAGRSA
jgi:hypothetical protein